MVKLFVFHTRDDSHEYWLRLKLDLLKGNKFIMQNGNISFHVNSYEVDELYSSSNWTDAFKFTKVCKLLTIEVASKKLKIDVEFSSDEASSFPERGPEFLAPFLFIDFFYKIDILCKAINHGEQ